MFKMLLTAIKRIPVFLLLICIFLSEENADADIAMHFLDVGHGDCTIIICDGDVMVVDGGRAGKSDMIFSFFRARNIDHVRAVVGTHPDSDHIGGLPAVFHAASVDVLYVPTLDHEAKRHNILMRTARDARASIIVPKDGESFQVGGALVTIIVPNVPNPTDNEMSLVVRIVYGDHAFLLCADIDSDIERLLLANGYDVSADVLKVAHHGSETATSPAFLQAVSPTYAVISGNDQYGAAKNDVTQRIQNAGITLLHTHFDGCVSITSTGEEITVKTEQ